MEGIILHHNSFSPLLSPSEPADQGNTGVWRGALRQYFESATALQDTTQQQQIMEDFSARFPAELPNLADTAASLTKPMVEWLKERLPAGSRDSYGEETDSQI
jgi:hypothetical protein